MKRVFQSLILLAAFAGSATLAAAQDGPPPAGPGGPIGPGGGQRFQMPTFADMDKNKDKKLTRDELPSFFPSQAFDRIDENKDGAIDEAEWERRPRMGGGGGGGGNARLSELLAKFMDQNQDSKITREEFNRLTQVFDALDQDKNGELTQEELTRFFQAMNEVAAQATGGVEVNNLFEKYDKDKDGKLVAEELNNEKSFKALDVNKDGSVTRAEAEQALRALAERSRQKEQAAKPQQ